jgi:hypothetical protein
MKRIFLLAFCVVTAFSVKATHIVGGEFEMLYKSTNPITGDQLYTISLILYFDAKNGSPGAKDGQVNIRIFRKRDNAIINNFIRLDSLPSTTVEYFQPECSSGLAIKTYRMYYTYTDGTGHQALYALSPETYSDPKGYYLAWERCCRNYSITNIFSENPDTGGTYAGQTFYLEFPPLKKDGVPFINSSPTLFPPLSDYACPGSLYYVDFAGTDPDGDSLVYTLVNPLNTKSGDALPPPIPPGVPRPGPYPSVLWRSPFGLNNIVAGKPDLKISIDGLLTVVPTLQGLYVFSVRCEEFRDKIKIGEVRRDFQLLVLAECKTASPPTVAASRHGENSFVTDNLYVPFDHGLPERCVDIKVKDADSNNPTDGNVEDVKIRAIPLGFKDNVSGIIPNISSAKLVGKDAFVVFTVCFPECPYPAHAVGPYKIGIIAMDNACPLPKLDTVIITVDVTPPPNNLPLFQESMVNKTVREDSLTYSHAIIGTDVDPDKLTLSLLPLDFDFAKYGFEFINQQPIENGKAKGLLKWNTKCDQIDFSEKTNFEIKFLLEDIDHCEITSPDTMVFNLNINLVDVHPPKIYFSPINGIDRIDVRDTTLTYKIFKDATFTVEGFDQDSTDFLVLSGKGIDFEQANLGATFPTRTGKPSLISNFNWPIQCDKVDLSKKDEYDFQFIVVDDQNRCDYYLADTLKVTVKVEPPDNEAPLIKLNGVDHLDLTYTVGDPISINLLGTDTDVLPTDMLTLKIDDVFGTVVPKNYSLTSTPSKANVTGIFTWLTDCSIFENHDFENEYLFTFSVTDDRCRVAKRDTSTVKITIHDRDPEPIKFIPPNFITPNNDGCNDYFAMENFELGDCGEVQVISLPKDNCAGRFVSINIYNRWGKQVYSSDSRNFRWYADNVSVGVYFYTVVFSNKEYKGAITVRL